MAQPTTKWPSPDLGADELIVTKKSVVKACIAGSVFLVFLAISFGYGLFVGVFKRPPYPALRSVYNVARGVLPLTADARYTGITPDAQATNVETEIQITSPGDVAAKREALVSFIWKGKGLPTRDTFDSTEALADGDGDYSGLGLKAIHKYTLLQEYGMKSVVLHFIAGEGKHQLIMLHSGHSGAIDKEKVKFFASRGYDVMAFSMPLLGLNNHPLVDIPRFGKIRMTQHEQLRLLDTDNFSAIRFFVEPIAVAFNFAKRNFDYSSISFVGLSGGGWTAELYAAIDPRLTRTYSIAGGYPLFLLDYDWGDYEQTLPDMYRLVNQLELYVLDSFGAGRKAVQVFNQHDSCCFAGLRYRLYQDVVKAKLQSLNQAGHFEVYLDSANYQHSISQPVLVKIDRDIQQSCENCEQEDPWEDLPK